MIKSGGGSGSGGGGAGGAGGGGGVWKKDKKEVSIEGVLKLLHTLVIFYCFSKI